MSEKNKKLFKKEGYLCPILTNKIGELTQCEKEWCGFWATFQEKCGVAMLGEIQSTLFKIQGKLGN